MQVIPGIGNIKGGPGDSDCVKTCQYIVVDSHIA